MEKRKTLKKLTASMLDEAFLEYQARHGSYYSSQCGTGYDRRPYFDAQLEMDVNLRELAGIINWLQGT
jgi:hypothetical protein